MTEYSPQSNEVLVPEPQHTPLTPEAQASLVASEASLAPIQREDLPKVGNQNEREYLGMGKTGREGGKYEPRYRDETKIARKFGLKIEGFGSSWERHGITLKSAEGGPSMFSSRVPAFDLETGKQIWLKPSDVQAGEIVYGNSYSGSGGFRVPVEILPPQGNLPGQYAEIVVNVTGDPEHRTFTASAGNLEQAPADVEDPATWPVATPEEEDQIERYTFDNPTAAFVKPNEDVEIAGLGTVKLVDPERKAWNNPVRLEFAPGKKVELLVQGSRWKPVKQKQLESYGTDPLSLAGNGTDFILRVDGAIVNVLTGVTENNQRFIITQPR